MGPDLSVEAEAIQAWQGTDLLSRVHAALGAGHQSLFEEEAARLRTRCPCEHINR